MLDDIVKKPQDVDFHPLPDPIYDCAVTPENTEKIFRGCADFESRRVFAGGTGAAVFACWLDGVTSGSDVAEQVLRPLTDPDRFAALKKPADVIAAIENGGVYGPSMKKALAMDELVDAITYGNCALVFEGAAFTFQVKTDQHRSVQEPTVEKSVKGGKDAFVEVLRVNTNLVRSRLHTPRLKLRQTTVGRKSRSLAAVMWLEGVAAPDLPERMLSRLEALDVDGVVLPDVLDSGLTDMPLSPFPQLLHTERPDKFAALLLEGRVGVIVEGIPVGFLAPAFLPEFLKTTEDVSQHFWAASAIRTLRWLSLVMTLLLPAFYVAVATYHPEMLPTTLLLSVIESKQSVPFSTAMEILGLLLAFELLQEAGLRLPNPVGQTVSIIGALIVGQSAVEAKVVSPIAVIVVALAGIAGYTMPSQDMGAALRIFRFALVLAATFAGMFGIIMGAVLLIWHLCSLESFGRAYMTPLTGGGGGSTGGTFVRRPPWRHVLRDPIINGGDIRRRK